MVKLLGPGLPTWRLGSGWLPLQEGVRRHWPLPPFPHPSLLASPVTGQPCAGQWRPGDLRNIFSPQAIPGSKEMSSNLKRERCSVGANRADGGPEACPLCGVLPLGWGGGLAVPEQMSPCSMGGRGARAGWPLGRGREEAGGTHCPEPQQDTPVAVCSVA